MVRHRFHTHHRLVFDESDEEELEENSHVISSEDESDHNQPHEEDEEEDKEEDEEGNDSDDSTRYRAPRGPSNKHASLFFEHEASEDEDDSSDNNVMMSDVDSDRSKSAAWPQLYNWNLDPGLSPWNELEAAKAPNRRRINPALVERHKNRAVSAKDLRITWNHETRQQDCEFKNFPKLPTELRVMIWELAFPEVAGAPRILPFCYSPADGASLLERPGLSTMTAGARVFMAINQETRAIGRDKFPTTLPIDDGGLIRFSPKNDVVWFVSFFTKFTHGEWPVIRGVTDKIRNLAIAPEALYTSSCPFRDRNLKSPFNFFNSFPRLKNVFLWSNALSNSSSVCDWVQSDNSITIRDIILEKDFHVTAHPKILSIPNIWNKRAELGIEKSDSLELNVKRIDSAQNEATKVDTADAGTPTHSIIGSDCVRYQHHFRQFVELAESIGNPCSLPRTVRWERLKKLEFYPLIEIEDMLWPLSLHIERLRGSEFGQHPDRPMFSNLFSLERTRMALDIPRHVLIDTLGIEETQRDDMPVGHGEQEGEIVEEEEDDDPLISEYNSGEEDLDELVMQMEEHTDDEDDDPAHGGFIGRKMRDRERRHAQEAEEEDEENEEDEYESDFVVADDEVEYGEGDTLPMENDFSDLEDEEEDNRPYKRRRVIVVDSDEEEMGEANSNASGSGHGPNSENSDALPLQNHKRRPPSVDTGYRGVTTLRQKHPIVLDSDSDEDYETLIVKSNGGGKRRRIVDDDEEDHEGGEGNDDQSSGDSANENSKKARRRVISDDEDE